MPGQLRAHGSGEILSEKLKWKTIVKTPKSTTVLHKHTERQASFPLYMRAHIGKGYTHTVGEWDLTIEDLKRKTTSLLDK